MQAEDAGNVMGFQNAALTQALGATGSLLGGLEQEQYVSGQSGEVSGHIFRQGQRHGGVAVVAAGVHLSGIRGGVGQTGALCHRQGVHIRPEGHSFRLPGVEKGTDAAGDGAGQGAVQRLQDRANISHSLGQLVVQLRDAVQSTAVVNNSMGHAGDLLEEIYSTYYNIPSEKGIEFLENFY